MREKPSLRFWQIWNMSFGFLGIQFGWGLQMANMSAIYSYLGALPSQIALLWLAAPVTGVIIQPLIGQASDRTWTRLGRRRPYGQHLFAGVMFVQDAAFVVLYPWRGMAMVPSIRDRRMAVTLALVALILVALVGLPAAALASAPGSIAGTITANGKAATRSTK